MKICVSILLLREQWSTLSSDEQERKRAIMLDPSAFLYDQQASLELTVLSERTRDGTTIQDITYASPRGGKVPAYLIFPSQQVPRAGLIFGNWGEGDREEFVDEAVVLARLGFVSLCPDGPFRRPMEHEPPLVEIPLGDVQEIVDVRRGGDLLTSHFELPSEHLGYVGHSHSANLGGVLAGIDHRIKVYVLMAGVSALSEYMQTTSHPLLVEERKHTPPKEYQAYLAALAPLDACHYIGQAAPSQLFFQFALDDEFVSAKDGERYFELASSPKQIAWYDHCHHAFNAQARLDRAIFLCEQLGLARPSQEMLHLLEQVPPPLPRED
jgi:cephalosporin-C deacetylase-like acetyl esterase